KSLEAARRYGSLGVDGERPRRRPSPVPGSRRPRFPHRRRPAELRAREYLGIVLLRAPPTLAHPQRGFPAHRKPRLQSRQRTCLGRITASAHRNRKEIAAAALLAVLVCVVARLDAVPPARPYAVEHYDVRISPDLDKQRITGEVAIRFHSTVDRLDSVELDAADTLQVESISEGKAALKFERSPGVVKISLPRAMQAGRARTLVIRYQAGPGRGLKFFPDQVFAAYFTNDWMVANDRPDGPATLRLTIKTPPGMKATASGIGSGPWTIDTPAPPF